MKKIYEKPVVNIITMELEKILQNSTESINVGGKYNGTTQIESNERRGIFSNDNAPSYNRNLW